MTDLALSALTDVILACEIFFLAGLSFRQEVAPASAAGAWAVALLLMGGSTMLGAIDHGFFEAIDHPAHAGLVVATRALVILAAFAMLVALVRQFLAGPLRRLVLGVGLVGMVGTIAAITQSDNFLIVIGGYSVVLLLTLAFHGADLLVRRRGRGSWAMVGGILGAIAASLLAPLGIDGPSWLGTYGTYHVALMPTVLLLYLGGRRLDSTP